MCECCVIARSLSHVQLFVTPWTVAHQASLSHTISLSLLKLMSIESVMVFQPSHPLLPPSPLALNHSQHQGLFQWAGSSNPVAKVLEGSASASVFPMSTRDWSPLGLTGWISLLSKGPSRVFSNTTVWKHQFFGAQPSLTVQLSHPYMTTGKTIALTIWIFVSKVMSLLLDILSRFVTAFPRSKHLLISWLQSPSALIFGSQEYEIRHCFHFFPIYLPWCDRTGCHDLRFLNVEF